MAAYPPPGALPLAEGKVRFHLWAPRPRDVELVLTRGGRVARVLPLERDEEGCATVDLEGAGPGTRYGYRINGGPEVLPDPASRDQPDGVHAPSRVVRADAVPWTDGAWEGRDLTELVLYEVHTGSFTPEGTFEGIARRLPRLSRLGVTALELMPVAAFPGERNWGYDGVFPYAVQSSYGGLEGLQRLANACHRAGLALVLDVVYNHVGPEGNRLGSFGPYFTSRYRTPWGAALNFEGPGSDQVRRFFLESARYLLRVAHLDGFRVDAVQAIEDPTARPFLAELTDAIHAEGRRLRRRVHLIAESSLNDPKVVRPTRRGGWGFDAMWNDDFHHGLHTGLTGERSGYYVDYDGLADLSKTLVEGFSLTGEYSHFRGRRHGARPTEVRAEQFVISTQNHDQVGNRPFGDRLSELVPFESLELAAGLLLLGPFVPLLFMGEEYGERAPFLYFTSHSDPRLSRAVRDGRRQEFPEVARSGARVPDPQARLTFERSRPAGFDHPTASQRRLLALYQSLLRLRAWAIPVRRLRSEEVAFERRTLSLTMHRDAQGRYPESLAVFHFSPIAGTVPIPSLREGARLLASSSTARKARGSTRPPSRLDARQPAGTVRLPPNSFVLYVGGAPRPDRRGT